MADQYSIRVHIEEVENGQFLATSDELPGLVAQGRTIEFHSGPRHRSHRLMGRLSGFSYRELTTIPNHPGDLPEGTVRAILKQADLQVDDFLNT